VNFLSSNLRFLRKRRRLSQQQLADDLGVKRSNIAAYETKNVEPRLALINDIAQYFDLSLEHLIMADLAGANEEELATFIGGSARLGTDSISEIKEVSDKIKRMLDGFRIFYEFKREMHESAQPGSESDIENFLVFINHMTEYNRLIEASISPDNGAAAPPTVDDLLPSLRVATTA
jgi:transcriptional regulator with XRE-family HTH domain